MYAVLINPLSKRCTVLHNKGQSIKGLYLKALYLKHQGKNQSAYEYSALSALSKSGFSDVYRGI